MKIGLVCPYNVFIGGGVQEVVLALQAGLQARGHTARIITPKPLGNNVTRPEYVIYLGASANVKSPFHTTAQGSLSLNQKEIDVALQDGAFDVLHFHEPWVPIMSRQLLRRSQACNVATFHAKLPDTMLSRSISRVVTPYTKSILRYFSALTAVSEAAAEYAHTLTNQPITIVPNGIDLGKYRHPKGHRGHKTILYIGRLEKRKGVIHLLRAFAKLSGTGAVVRLVVAGDGPDRPKLEQFVRDNALTSVEFAGYVDELKKLKLLAQADLFCSPALYGESFGIVLLEAMAMGVPVVAGNNPGYASVMVGQGSVSLVDPTDTDAFSRKLGLLLADNALRLKWQAWAEGHVRQFDYSHVVRQYEAVYKEALAR